VSNTAERDRVANTFDTPEHAANHSSEIDSRHHQRSRDCVLAALQSVPSGSSILDLPCGTGRLTQLLIDQGYRYTGADVSSRLVDAARAKFQSLADPASSDQVLGFDVEDITAMSYEDGQFDAVVVSRLFHHFTQAETRVDALSELRRVCHGPIIVFFTNVWTLLGIKFLLVHLRDNPMQRRPISLTELRSNCREAGLEIKETFATRGRYNKEWYAVLQRLG